MIRKHPPAFQRPAVLIEALEPRIAPAALLESKFTSVAVGTPLLLDASGAPGTFQGLTTGSGGGSGSYLLYITSGRALVFTTDLNGNGRLDPGEITGISLGKDSLGHDPALILFSDVHGDIVTNLQGTTGSTLTDSDNNPNNGRDGQLLTDTNIASIQIRTLTAADIDSSIPGNTVANRLALTSFSIYGNIVAGGNVGSVTVDTSGISNLVTKFTGIAGDQYFTGANPSIEGIYTGTAANNLAFHFTENNPFTPQVEGTIQGFKPSVGEHGGDISNVMAASTATVFSIGTMDTGDGGAGARGGDLTNIVMHGATGSYELIAGNGGDGSTGGMGGSISGFNDLGTITGQVLLHTGDGGTGLLGAGGDGGTATFATTQIAAGVEVLMGRGGAGFTNGGNGASFTSGAFNTPETPTPTGTAFVGGFQGTWHDIGDIGHTHPLADGTYAPEAVDFNGDGFGDGVFATTAPDAVNVIFGDGFGGLLDNGGNVNLASHLVVSLKIPGVTNPVFTIGDFNGDGRPDIAVASGDPHNFGGVYVFLNQIGTALDPINSHNFTHSPVGDHPFSAAHQSALPTLEDEGFYETSGAVIALVAGDFNGDGITDLAYAQNIIAEGSFVGAQSIGVLLGDALTNPTTGAQLHDPTTGRIMGSGYFYANAAAPKAAAILDNVTDNRGIDVIQATSLASGNLPDATTGLPGTSEVFAYGKQGDKAVTTFGLALADPTSHASAGLVIEGGFALGKVDTNRNLGANNIALTDATLQTFQFQDVDNDGNADVVVLTKTPANFLITYQGDGMGGLVKQSGSGDNAGIAVGGGVGLAMTASDTNTDPAHVGTFDTVAILTLPTVPDPFIQEVLLRDNTNTPSFYYNNGGPTIGREFDLGSAVQDQTVQSLDAFYAVAPFIPAPASQTPNDPAAHPDTGYGALTPETSSYLYEYLVISTAPNNLAATDLPFTEFFYLTENGYAIHSGDGGAATSGAGGKGGVVGGTTAGLGGGTGAVTVLFPAAASYEGTLTLQGGDGGSGYGGGGAGGDITGISLRYAAAATVLTGDAELAAGNGGNGIGGDGGRGGNLSLLSIETGSFFSAGNAGNGLHGGTGGAITGNQAGVYDTANDAVTLITGTGGQGALQGGDGGTISNWDSEFLDFVGTGGLLSYTTGSGGGAAGGTGGSGGSILNSSPDLNLNNLSGPLALQTGSGGSGLTGGNGGAITNFNNNATTQSAVPTELTVLTGGGGVGVSGAGGNGGTITNFSSNATGLTSFSGFEDLTGIGVVIAGDGGASFGATGGTGGSISHVTATATSTPLVVAGGAGGVGLTVGGAGGSVTDSSINSAAAQIGKLLVVAGAGGDALAAQPGDVFLPADSNTTDLAHAILAFGNASGVAGNGGNITNITQPIGAQTAVDLIAGNGGSTPNAGSSVTLSTGVGHGGSVSNVVLTGTVGAISRDLTQGITTNPEIQAYAATDEFGTTTTLSISAIIDLLANPSNGYGALGDNSVGGVPLSITGNVGIVAGASGTVRGGQPAADGVNGDVTGVTAASFMSIVAGSVTNVAPVRVVSGLTVTNSDGVLGADRSPTPVILANGQTSFPPNGVLDYYDPTLGQDVTSLSPGDSLIDGAIFASTIQQTSGTQIRGPRVFFPSA